jgi:hypothetical protein
VFVPTQPVSPPDAIEDPAEVETGVEPDAPEPTGAPSSEPAPEEGGVVLEPLDSGETDEPDDDDDSRDDSPSRSRAPVTDATVKRKLRRRARSQCRGLGAGRVEVGFSIRSDGGVMMVVAKPPHADDPVGRCVARVVADGHFPKGTLRRESLTVSL